MPLRFPPLTPPPSPPFTRADWSASRVKECLPFTELVILAAVGMALALA